MEYLEASPVSSTQIKTWTDRDPVLAKVRDWDATPETEAEELRPPSSGELSVENRCLLWGNRVIVSKNLKGQRQVVRMLYQAHPRHCMHKKACSKLHTYVWCGLAFMKIWRNVSGSPVK